MIRVHIDPNSGFCFGVVTAVKKVEKFLSENPGKQLFCLGSIMHNAEEVKRLEGLGMVTINHNNLSEIKASPVMIRAHGEPPSTYKEIEKAGHNLLDATCPVVLKLQLRIKEAYIENPGRQIVIFGKKGHAEVIGLQGQTNNQAIVITECSEVKVSINPQIPVILFSQTTMPQDKFETVSKCIQEHCQSEVVVHNTICKRVSNREQELREFSKKHDAVIFISGKDSSNGNLLFKVCQTINPKTWFVSSVDEVQASWFIDGMSVGVCGATSTPLWLMEQVASTIEKFYP
jgi:4-hydroxy-3-methylbut-2-enyl diphosphate reductase